MQAGTREGESEEGRKGGKEEGRKGEEEEGGGRGGGVVIYPLLLSKELLL